MRILTRRSLNAVHHRRYVLDWTAMYRTDIENHPQSTKTCPAHKKKCIKLPDSPAPKGAPSEQFDSGCKKSLATNFTNLTNFVMQNQVRRKTCSECLNFNSGNFHQPRLFWFFFVWRKRTFTYSAKKNELSFLANQICKH